MSTPSPLYALPEDKKIVLFPGVASAVAERLHQNFRGDAWHCVRVDPVEAANPDLQHMPVKLAMFANASVDAIWAPQLLHRFFLHDIEAALREYFRLLKDEGSIYITVPDLQLAASYVVHSRHSEKLHLTGAPTTPIEMLYGDARALQKGMGHFQHRFGFTPDLLGAKLREAGFTNIQVKAGKLEINATAQRFAYENPKRVERLAVIPNPLLKGNMADAPPALTQGAHAAHDPRMDLLDLPPVQWKPLGLRQA